MAIRDKSPAHGKAMENKKIIVHGIDSRLRDAKARRTYATQ